MTQLRRGIMTRVLVVEDSPTQAQQLALVLVDAGFDVKIAVDAESALDLVHRDRFDVVLSDLVLPGLSGFELCRRLKSDPATRHIPVVVQTSQADPVNVLRGLEAGADGFMTKDRPASEIVRRVHRALSGGARTVGDGTHAVTQAAFLGEEFRLTAGREQLLNILLSAFEDVIELNERTRASEAALRELNGELRKTNQALAEANEVKDKFLRIAAHDLRNPLAVIQGLGSILLEGLEGPVNEEQSDALRRIVRQTDSMLELLTELLDVSALRAGKLEIKPRLQDPTRVLRESFDAFVLRARDKKIDLVWDVSEGLPLAEFDSHRMLEVMSNLISNAVKFSLPGSVVRLSARESAGMLEMSVRDSGQGISDSDLPRLFEPFSRLGTKPTGGEKSTGLGLSIVKEIVELHHGRVSATSKKGEGSTFTVRLPLARSSFVERHQSAS